MIAPALPEDEPYLRRLGVPDIVPRDSDVVAAVRQRYRDGVDALLDTVSYEPGAYDRALKDGARIASPNNAAGEGVGRTNRMAAPTTENLERLARLLDAGTVTVPIHQTYPLEQAAAAMNALATAHTQSKPVRKRRPQLVRCEQLVCAGGDDGIQAGVTLPLTPRNQQVARSFAERSGWSGRWRACRPRRRPR